MVSLLPAEMMCAGTSPSEGLVGALRLLKDVQYSEAGIGEQECWVARGRLYHDYLAHTQTLRNCLRGCLQVRMWLVVVVRGDVRFSGGVGWEAVGLSGSYVGVKEVRWG